MAEAHILVYADITPYEPGVDPVFVAVSIAGDIEALKALAQEDVRNRGAARAYQSAPLLTWTALYSSTVSYDYADYQYYIEPAPLIDDVIDTKALDDLRADVFAAIHSKT